MELTKNLLAQYYYIPATKAAEKLNYGLTVFTERCQRLGIKRWPYRKLTSLQRLINNVQEGISSDREIANNLYQVIALLEEEKRRIEEDPNIPLSRETKRLRQAYFKKIYNKRKRMRLVPVVDVSDAVPLNIVYPADYFGEPSSPQDMESGIHGNSG